jgi:SNF2 family DNA or RNA helicase
MITEGTLEERVDDILQSKSALAGSLIAGGESFLLKMSAEELDAVVGLK